MGSVSTEVRLAVKVEDNSSSSRLLPWWLWSLIKQKEEIQKKTRSLTSSLSRDRQWHTTHSSIIRIKASRRGRRNPSASPNKNNHTVFIANTRNPNGTRSFCMQEAHMYANKDKRKTDILLTNTPSPRFYGWFVRGVMTVVTSETRHCQVLSPITIHRNLAQSCKAIASNHAIFFLRIIPGMRKRGRFITFLMRKLQNSLS